MDRDCVCVSVCVCVGGLLGKTENLISGMHCASLPLAIQHVEGGMDGYLCECVCACIIGQ